MDSIVEQINSEPAEVVRAHADMGLACSIGEENHIRLLRVDSVPLRGPAISFEVSCV
jgi:hypothetical protein